MKQKPKRTAQGSYDDAAQQINRDILSKPQAANFIGCSLCDLDGLVRRRLIPSAHLARRRAFRRSALLEAMGLGEFAKPRLGTISDGSRLLFAVEYYAQGDMAVVLLQLMLEEVSRG